RRRRQRPRPGPEHRRAHLRGRRLADRDRQRRRARHPRQGRDPRAADRERRYRLKRPPSRPPHAFLTRPSRAPHDRAGKLHAVDTRISRSRRLASLLSHQASSSAIALFVVLWTMSAFVRFALAAARWNELDHDPSALLAALALGEAIDALLAFATAAMALAFGALTHSGAGGGSIRSARRTLGFAVEIGRA